MRFRVNPTKAFCILTIGFVMASAGCAPVAQRASWERYMSSLNLYFGPSRLITPENTLWELAMSHGAEEFQRGRYNEAEKRFLAALKEGEAFGSENPRVAVSLNAVAEVFALQGRYAEADAHIRRALEISEKSLGQNHKLVAEALENIARLYYAQRKYPEAETFALRAQAISEKGSGEGSLLVAIYDAQGKHTEAERLALHDLRDSEKAWGPNHPQLAVLLRIAAARARAQGRHAEAEQLGRRALSIREKALGPEHPNVASFMNFLAWLLEKQGRHSEAEVLYKRSLAIVEKALGQKDPAVAKGMDRLAAIYHAQGKYAEAEALYKRSLETLEKALSLEPKLVAQVLGHYASLLRKVNREAEAEKLQARAATVLAKHVQKDKPRWPAEARQGSCRLWVHPSMWPPNFHIGSEGLKSGEEISMVSRFDGDILIGRGQGPKEGALNIIQAAPVPYGEPVGSASFTMKSQSCDLTVHYDWEWPGLVPQPAQAQ